MTKSAVFSVLVPLMAALLSHPLPAHAQSYEFPGRDGGRTLVVYSTTDIEAARPLIEDFRKLWADITVRYHDIQSQVIYQRIIEESDGPGVTADLAFSSVMDLQMKLANDGYAQPHKADSVDGLPSWANWRNEAFGVTFEPVVIVYNKTYFRGREVPTTRTGLAEALSSPHSEFFGKVATYDIERSGFGFFALARDQEHYSATWNLVRAMGRNSVKLFSKSAAILDQLSTGNIVLGYNVLGTYAASRAERDPAIGVVLPTDFTVVLSRIALIPRKARSPETGKLFLDYLLSERGQRVLSEQSGLNSIHTRVTGPRTAANMQTEAGASLRPVKVGPGLLVYLDQFKRARMIDTWEKALTGR